MIFDPQSILIWNKFDYNFVEKTHTYYYQNQYPVKYSVTQYISRYFPEFDSEKVSANYAKKHGLTKEEVLADWKRKGDISSISGTLIHSWLENAKEVARAINNGSGFTFNGKKVDYAVAGITSNGQATIIVGYDSIRETSCFEISGYRPGITDSKEVKFLKQETYYTFL